MITEKELEEILKLKRQIQSLSGCSDTVSRFEHLVNFNQIEVKLLVDKLFSKQLDLLKSRYKELIKEEEE